MPDTPNPTINENDLLVTVVRIDSRTKAMQDAIGELKTALVAKADVERVAKLEQRLDASDRKHEKMDTKLNRIMGGAIVVELFAKLMLGR